MRFRKKRGRRETTAITSAANVCNNPYHCDIHGLVMSGQITVTP